MKTSRRRLYDYIQTHRIVTVADLALALGMTSANIRHHLTQLEAQGLVDVVGQRPLEGRGRPVQLYGLSEKVLGHHFDGLVRVFLDLFVTPIPADRQLEIFEQIADRLALMYAAGQPGSSLAQRLLQVVRKLNELHYLARWEAHAEAPRLILGHCPYLAILPDHPELCQIDGLFLSRLLGLPVDLTARLACDAKGGTFCIFSVLKRD